MMSTSRRCARSVTRERDPRRDGGEQLQGVERRVGHDLRRCAEPALRDRPADADAEDEAEELDEGARGVRDAGLEVLRRELAHPHRERHAGQEGHEGRERDDVG